MFRWSPRVWSSSPYPELDLLGFGHVILEQDRIVQMLANTEEESAWGWEWI